MKKYIINGIAGNYSDYYTINDIINDDNFFLNSVGDNSLYIISKNQFICDRNLASPLIVVKDSQNNNVSGYMDFADNPSAYFCPNGIYSAVKGSTIYTQNTSKDGCRFIYNLCFSPFITLDGVKYYLTYNLNNGYLRSSVSYTYSSFGQQYQSISNSNLFYYSNYNTNSIGGIVNVNIMNSNKMVLAEETYKNLEFLLSMSRNYDDLTEVLETNIEEIFLSGYNKPIIIPRSNLGKNLPKSAKIYIYQPQKLYYISGFCSSASEMTYIQNSFSSEKLYKTKDIYYLRTSYLDQGYVAITSGYNNYENMMNHFKDYQKVYYLDGVNNTGTTSSLYCYCFSYNAGTDNEYYVTYYDNPNTTLFQDISFYSVNIGDLGFKNLYQISGTLYLQVQNKSKPGFSWGEWYGSRSAMTYHSEGTNCLSGYTLYITDQYTQYISYLSFLQNPQIYSVGTTNYQTFNCPNHQNLIENREIYYISIDPASYTISV